MKVYEYAVATTNDDCVADIRQHMKLKSEAANLADITKSYRREYDMPDLVLVACAEDYTYSDGDENDDKMPSNTLLFNLYNPLQGRYIENDNAPDGLIVIVEV